MGKVIRFLKDEEGVTAIEYALIAAGIGIGIVVIVTLIGPLLAYRFNHVANSLTD